jgi:hypothetical protein
MQFIKRGLHWLQGSISNKLHNHFFSSIIIDTTSNLHHTHLKSCVGPRTNAWIFVHLVIPPFHIASNVFPYVLCTKLGLPHPLVLRVIHCIGGQTLNLTWNHHLCCSHGGEWITSHDIIWNAFAFTVRHIGLHVSSKQTYVLPPLPFNLFIDGLTLCYQLMTFTPWLMWSSSIPLNKFGFLCYFISWGGYDNGNPSKEKTLTQSSPKERISSPCDKSFWVFTLINRWFFSSLC